MFFDVVLFHPQHRSQLRIPWIAGTCGIKYLKKNEIAKCNVLDLCGFLERFMTNESSDPKKRFSLRLSAILLNGTVKVYAKQVEVLYDNLFKFHFTVSTKPSRTLKTLEESEESSISQATPVPIVKRKRKKPENTPQTPESLVAEGTQAVPFSFLQDGQHGDVQARLEDITLQESPPRKIQVDYQLEDFGFEEVAVDPVQTHAELVPPVLVPSPRSNSPNAIPGTITVTAQIHALPTEEEIALELPPIEKSQTVPFPLADITEKINKRNETRLRNVPDDLIEVVPEPEAVATPKEPDVVQEKQIVLEEELPLRTLPEEGQLPSERSHVRRFNKLENLMIVEKKKRFVKINRCLPGQDRYIDVFEPEMKPFKHVDISKLLDKFWKGPEEMRAVQGVGRGTSRISLQESLDEMRRTMSSHSEGSGVGLLSAHQLTDPSPFAQPSLDAVITSTPHTPKRQPLRDQTTEETVAEAGAALERRKRRRIVDELEIDFPEQVQTEGKVHTESPEKFMEVENFPTEQHPEGLSQSSQILEFIDIKQRHQKIIEIVSSWNDEGGHLTIETISMHVCMGINRLYIARTFSDLLMLARSGYVALKSEEHSLELKYIEKGSKLN